MATLPDIVLYPHCDLHVALHGAAPLNLRVMHRVATPGDPTRHTLTDVTTQCTFDFFAPYQAVGHRFDNLPAVDPATGLVNAPNLGTYLFLVHFHNDYLPARLQVHDTLRGWWFGNASITTALDARFAHAQPSIYASFSDDPSGTDLVGDITGHGYVTLTSQTPAQFSVDARGRLQGVSEGGGTLRGQHLGVTHDLPVRVFDYARRRATLDSIQVPDLDRAAGMHNILFLAEGFRDNPDDREKFDEIVTKVVDEIFDKPRHAPYNILEGSFNVWKAYEPSQQHALTCAYRVQDEDVPDILPKGYPIPYESQLVTDGTKYTPQLLVQLVGLPLRNEAGDPATLLALWTSQSLSASFTAARVDPKVVNAWKGQKSNGLLEARDTIFGLCLGQRHADQTAGFGARIVVAVDTAGAALASFVTRLYEWFRLRASRIPSLDPRRHPPEVLASAGGDENPGTAIMQYISNLCWLYDETRNIGPVWVPDANAPALKPSRGLVAVISNDGLHGGAAICLRTLTVNTIATALNVGFEYAVAGQERVMRRTPPDAIGADVGGIIDTIAHEFGHSFNLGDEYEDFAGDNGFATVDPGQDAVYDNIARLAAIYANGVIQPNGQVNFNTDQIIPGQVKWLQLQRIRESAALVKPSEPTPTGGGIKVTIDTRFIRRWVDVMQSHRQVDLRAPSITPAGKQLPLPTDSAHYLGSLEVIAVDEGLGELHLFGPSLPAPPFPVFPRGSLIFVPLRDGEANLRYVCEAKVLAKMVATQLPLNRDTDIATVNKDEDTPVDISDFKPPCKSYKLIGVYNGASQYSNRFFRPAGLCKMRKSTDDGTGDGEFCHVCKWLIVNRVDPSLHDLLDKLYFPTAKKNG